MRLQARSPSPYSLQLMSWGSMADKSVCALVAQCTCRLRPRTWHFCDACTSIGGGTTYRQAVPSWHFLTIFLMHALSSVYGRVWVPCWHNIRFAPPSASSIGMHMRMQRTAVSRTFSNPLCKVPACHSCAFIHVLITPPYAATDEGVARRATTKRSSRPTV